MVPKSLVAVCLGLAVLSPAQAVIQGHHLDVSKKDSQSLGDSHFWAQQGGETYSHHQGRYFKPSISSTFSLIKLNNVNVTFLDNTNLRGYDGADMATLGKYSVMTRMGMIEHCNSRNFDDVDGILGFGWADQPRSAALLKTLTQPTRPGWNIESQPFEGNGIPMPRKFAFTANNQLGELQLGGYDPTMLHDGLTEFHMTGENVYGIDIHSITYGGVELLNFEPTLAKKSYVGEFDSGTTCLLLPNSDVKGNFSTSPFGILAREQMKGEKHPLLYHATDIHGNVKTYSMAYTECVEPTDETMILGDPFFRKFVVFHDIEDLKAPKMGLGVKNPAYKLGAQTDRSILTPGHAPTQTMFSANNNQVSKIHATRKMRDHAFTQALHETKRAMARTSELQGGSSVDKVAVKSQSMVTYNIQLAIGSPPQPLDVIFDTGSFMLAIFAEAPPAGMKPLLKDKKKAAKGHTKGLTKAHENHNKALHKKMEHHLEHQASHVARAAEPIELMQAPGATQSYAFTGQEMSLTHWVSAVAVCSTVLMAGLVAVIRRRRSPLTSAGQPLESYGSC